MNRNQASMSAIHLADSPELFDPSRSNNFELLIVFKDGDLPLGGIRRRDKDISDPDSVIQSATEIIRLSVVASSVPSFQLGKINIQVGNHTINFAGKPTMNDLSLQINDFVSANTYEILNAWYSKAYDINTQKVGRAKDYKITCHLHQYSPDYETRIRTWKLKGCWLSNLVAPDFNNEQNNKVVLNATLTYDIFEVVSE